MPEELPLDDATPEKPEKPKTLPTAAPDAASQALEQAAEYGSVFEPTVLKLDDGTTIKIPPHPTFRLLDDDVLEALDQLAFDIDEECHRYPDIFVPEETKTDRSGAEITIPAHTVRGALKIPYRKTDPETGKAVKLEPQEITEAKIILGEENYAKLRAGTINGERGSVAHIKNAWRNQGTKIEERQASDPKSDGGAVDSEAVSPPDPA